MLVIFSRNLGVQGMVNCPNCGKTLIDDAVFCTRCGSPLKTKAASSPTHRFDQAGKSLENWYDRSFGILGPLLASLLFLIIVRLVIELVRSSGTEILEMDEITSVLLLYLLPLFCVTLLSNYTSYFARRSEKFKVFSPLFHAIAFILVLWIVAQILHSLHDRLAVQGLATAATSLQNALPGIFVFVLLLGYVFLALNMSKEQKKKL